MSHKRSGQNATRPPALAGASTSANGSAKPTTPAIQLAPTEWGVASGYGRAAVSIAKALKEIGAVVGFVGRPKVVGEAPPVPDVYDGHAPVLHIGDPTVYQLVAGARNIGFCWWPYSKMPTAWIRAMYGLEELLVPSPWCASGVVFPNPNQTAHVVPLGVDGETFVPTRRERGETLRFMVFAGNAGDYSSGADIAVAAFMRAFPNDRRADVALDIWSTQPIDIAAPDPRINLRRHIGTDADLVRLYDRYDALIASDRGAGFGIVPIEAMATGMPVFHTGQGAFAAIDDLGILIGARRRPTVITAHESADCFEPLYDILATRLGQLDTSYDGFQEQAIEDAATVRERFTWEKTARAIIEAIG